MSILQIGMILLMALFVLLGSGLWVAVSLLGVGFIALSAFTSTPTDMVLGGSVWGSISTWSLAPLPLFIWMGEILFHSRLSEDMFAGLAPWLGRLPGRLLHVNIIGSGVFAAVSGSSAATCATIGRMTYPELTKRGYDERMVIGTLAGSGTLGLLIPPSIMLIVYGISAQVSIARLFMAGMLPGVLLVLLFMGYVALWSLLHPRQSPPAEPATTLGAALRDSARLFPVLALIVLVIGSIYAGFATPTESAAFGVVGALALSAATGALNWATFRESLRAATRTSCMIGFILAGASVLSVAMGYIDLPTTLAQWIASQHLPKYALLAALLVMFLVMGCFLDGISVVVLTTSVVLPMVHDAGIDLIWFGIFLVIAVEMAQVTPPVGFNLFVLQGLTGRDILAIAMAAIPFFLILLVADAIITLFPMIATWLPATMSHS